MGQLIQVRFGVWDGGGLLMHRHYKPSSQSCALDNETEAARLQANRSDKEAMNRAAEQARVATLRRKYKEQETLRDMYGDDTKHLARTRK